MKEDLKSAIVVAGHQYVTWTSMMLLLPASNLDTAYIHVMHNAIYSGGCDSILSYVAVFTTGYGSSQSAISSLTCQSSYNHLNECTINAYSSCTTSTTLSLPSCSRAIRCTRKNTDFVYCKITFKNRAAYPDQACPEGAVRLADGQIEQEGRVEVCLGGVWGLICRYGWNPVDAYVACKQLGYNPGIG